MRREAKWMMAVGVGLALSSPILGQNAPPARGQVAPPAGGAAPPTSPGSAAPVAAPRAPAAPATQGPKPLTPEAQAKIDAILKGWEQASADIETIYAEFEQVDRLVIVGEEKKFRGKAYLKRPNLALLQLEKEDAEKKSYVFDRRIICTGKEVLEFDAAAKQVTIFPLPKDAQQRALEEGPLPFLFNMKLNEFKQRYHAYLQQESQRSYRIVIQPLQAIDRDAFHTAVLDLNKETLLPDAIYTLSANGKDQQNYVFRDPTSTKSTIQKNATFPDSLFVWDNNQARALGQKGWRVIRNPAPGDSEMELTPINPGTVGQRPAGGAIPR